MHRKEIIYNRETHDYAMVLDGEPVGFARTYHEAEVTLDQLIFDRITRHPSDPSDPTPAPSAIPSTPPSH